MQRVKEPKTVALPDGALVCRSCGVIVKRPDASRTEVIRQLPPHAEAMIARGVQVGANETDVTRCDECSDRRAHAELLLVEHPRVARAHGQVGVERLDAALAALDLCGLRGGRLLRMLTETDLALRDLLEIMAPLGAAASWSVSGQMATGKRWAHVRPDHMAETRASMKRLARLLVDFPRPIAPPTTDGALSACVFCGIGTLQAREIDALAVWGEQRRVYPSALGGRARPEPVNGYLCPRCRAACARSGGVGLPAASLALLAHLGFERTGFGVTLQDGVASPWAAMKPGTAPNRTPWAHLDLAKITRSLDKSPRMRRAVAG